eukprot:TRINITY_DN11523_c0_g1_i1.p1 TRINITY_DN11523_c0_g1~~TRINITY_DN11523_c0_g1_i1.p1  ORF type:complete len:654 (+),score=144.17 TRINITY_DN11523_c0_g1_i1:47-1963(+)
MDNCIIWLIIKSKAEWHDEPKYESMILFKNIENKFDNPSFLAQMRDGMFNWVVAYDTMDVLVPLIEHKSGLSFTYHIECGINRENAFSTNVTRTLKNGFEQSSNAILKYYFAVSRFHSSTPKDFTLFSQKASLICRLLDLYFSTYSSIPDMEYVNHTFIDSTFYWTLLDSVEICYSLPCFQVSALEGLSVHSSMDGKKKKIFSFLGSMTEDVAKLSEGAKRNQGNTFGYFFSNGMLLAHSHADSKGRTASPKFSNRFPTTTQSILTEYALAIWLQELRLEGNRGGWKYGESLASRNEMTKKTSVAVSSFSQDILNFPSTPLPEEPLTPTIEAGLTPGFQASRLLPPNSFERLASAKELSSLRTSDNAVQLRDSIILLPFVRRDGEFHQPFLLITVPFVPEEIDKAMFFAVIPLRKEALYAITNTFPSSDLAAIAAVEEFKTTPLLTDELADQLSSTLMDIITDSRRILLQISHLRLNMLPFAANYPGMFCYLWFDRRGSQHTFFVTDMACNIQSNNFSNDTFVKEMRRAMISFYRRAQRRLLSYGDAYYVEVASKLQFVYLCTFTSKSGSVEPVSIPIEQLKNHPLSSGEDLFKFYSHISDNDVREVDIFETVGVFVSALSFQNCLILLQTLNCSMLD